MRRRPTTQQQILRTLRFSTLEGAFTQIFLNWTSGSVLIGYMLYFGATPTQLGLVASVPLLAQVVSPFAAYLASLAGRRKYLTMLGAGVGRGLWLLAAALPQLGLAPAASASLMVVLVLVSSVFQAGAGTLWTAWMGDVVPADRRGRYFGTRAGIVGVVGMLANLAVGWFLDQVGAPINFQVALLVSVLSAVLGAVSLYFHYEPPASGQPFGLRDTFRIPLQDRNFRRFMIFALYWQFAVLLAAPFVFPYFLDSLRMSFTQIAVWSVIASLSALVTTNLWGRVADRFGNKAVLAIGTVTAGVALPGTWIAAGLTGNLWFIWVSAVFDAIAWGAIGPAIFNLALVSAPQQGRVAFIAMYSLATGISGFLGGLLSGPLLSALSQLEFTLGGVRWSAYHWLFLLSGIARAQAWRFLRGVEETNAWRTRDVLRQLRFGWRGMGFPWRN
jgi:MFS family permease